MATTKKHQEFVRESMKDKPIIAISGIGDSISSYFNRKGFSHAYHLLGQFLLLSCDEIIFKTWLETEFSFIAEKQRNDIYFALSEWCRNNL